MMTTEERLMSLSPATTPSPDNWVREKVGKIVLLLGIAGMLSSYYMTLPSPLTPEKKVQAGAIIINRQGQIVQWSLEAEKLTGYTSAEVFGKEIFWLARPKMREQQRNQIARECEKSKTTMVSFEILSKTKAPIEVELCLGGTQEYQFLGVVKGR